MTKRFAFGCLLAAVCSQDVQAQDSPVLTLPGSPAFSILDREPSAVMRPTHARSLASDVLNSFDADGKLLMNVGLEVSPYWLGSHPSLNHDTYLHPGLVQTMLQSLSLSAATVKDSASGQNKLGAGFRLKLKNGHPLAASQEATAALQTRNSVVNTINAMLRLPYTTTITKEKNLEALLNNLRKKDIPDGMVEQVKAEALALIPDYGDTESEIKQWLQALLHQRVEANRRLASAASDLLYVREGWIVELAGGAGFNARKHPAFERAGVWANVSYAAKGATMLTLTARYLHRNKDTSLSTMDMGLGVLKETTNYNLSLECMARYYNATRPDSNANHQPILRHETGFTYRLAAQGSYRISPFVSVNMSIGKDFNSPMMTTTGIFSILGLNYSIFEKKVEDEE